MLIEYIFVLVLFIIKITNIRKINFKFFLCFEFRKRNVKIFYISKNNFAFLYNINFVLLFVVWYFCLIKIFYAA